MSAARSRCPSAKARSSSRPTAAPFLDEIGDMDLTAQQKCWGSQNGDRCVGSEHVLHVDVRVLAATNRTSP